MKYILLQLANLISKIWRLIPTKLRTHLLTGLLILESRGHNSANGLRRLLLIKKQLEWVINERAMAYGKGEHPKHRLTRYHWFFIDRIRDGERVLDIGCGYGAVARSIALERPKSTVIGVDMSELRISEARLFANPPNLHFILGDATRDIPPGPWNVLVLSNVLEHISARINFLNKLVHSTGVARILIRVPLFERDWQIPLCQELGIGYFSDNDHKIEHKLTEFYDEINLAGLRVIEVMTLWGEIWADCRIK